MSKIHTHQVRVYYEDTDAGGVVYYSNYLKYAERARTEWLRDKGINQSELAETHDVLFAVRDATLDIQKPARLDDLLTVETEVVEQRKASFKMVQRIKRDNVLLVQIGVKIACISAAFKPIKIPDFIA